MRWFHELLFPTALLVTFASFWVAAEAKSLEQQARQSCPPADPVLSRHVIQTYGWRGAAAAVPPGCEASPCTFLRSAAD